MLTTKNNEESYTEDELGPEEIKAKEVDMMLDIMQCEKNISESLDERFGNGASEKAYSIEHYSLAGTKVASIELDIHPSNKTRSSTPD